MILNALSEERGKDRSFVDAKLVTEMQFRRVKCVQKMLPATYIYRYIDVNRTVDVHSELFNTYNIRHVCCDFMLFPATTRTPGGGVGNHGGPREVCPG